MVEDRYKYLVTKFLKRDQIRGYDSLNDKYPSEYAFSGINLNHAALFTLKLLQDDAG